MIPTSRILFTGHAASGWALSPDNLHDPVARGEGPSMLGELGIGMADLAWIERDQFVYYVEMERQLGDPSDWSSFQKGLVRALETAFGWEPAEPGGDDLTQNLIALDAIRRDHDPGTEWDAFLEALWQARGSLRSPRATSA